MASPPFQTSAGQSVLSALIVLSTVGTAILDWFTPLGITVWVFVRGAAAIHLLATSVQGTCTDGGSQFGPDPPHVRLVESYSHRRYSQSHDGGCRAVDDGLPPRPD